MTIGIIGAGNMGSALAKSFIRKGIAPPANITLSDTWPEKLQQLEDELGVKSTADNRELLNKELLILAVKPQGFPELTQQIAQAIDENCIVLSIMAGISSSRLQKDLGHERVVVCMPNTPAIVNEGVSAWFASEAIKSEEKQLIQELLESTGMAFEVESEEEIGKIGLLSGCGPGFFFYVFDQWMQAAAAEGIPQDRAKQILSQTFKGSLTLMMNADESPLELSQQVASKGGVTEQGLQVLNNAHLKELFSEMMQKAYKRYLELGSS